MKISKLNVLLAEDSEDDVLMFKRALGRCGIVYTLYVASDGREAIDYLRGEGKFADRGVYPFPTLLILDIKMPRLSGMDVLQWLHDHEECSVIPTIVLSSSALSADIKKAYRLAANAYFTKPNSPEELCDMVKLILSYWKLAHVPDPPQTSKCS
ncbi:MAG: response regulator [Limisphaerales bacterium]